MDKDPRGPSRCRLVPRESSLQGWVSSALGDTLTQMGSSCVCRKMSPNKGWVLTHSSPPGKPCIPTSGVAHPAGMQSHPGPHGPPPGRAQRDPSAPSGLCQSCSKKALGWFPPLPRTHSHTSTEGICPLHKLRCPGVWQETGCRCTARTRAEAGKPGACASLVMYQTAFSQMLTSQICLCHLTGRKEQEYPGDTAPALRTRV